MGNRGVDRTDLYRDDEDHRRFLALLAGARRRGWIEIHAWCLMSNHFHLLVRSPAGELARAMRWVQDCYAHYFNEKYGLKGHRFEARYWGKLIRSNTYRRVAFGYIHRNPRDAGLEEDGVPYPWTSERDYEAEKGRPWLTRTFGARLPAAVSSGHAIPRGLAEAWLTSKSADTKELDRLLRSGVNTLKRWLVEGASRAAASVPSAFLVRPTTLLEVLRSGQAEAPGASTRASQRTVSVWPLLLAGLLRTLCSANFPVVAEFADTSKSTAEGRVRRHRRALLEDERYARRAALVMKICLQREYGEQRE